MKLDYVELCGFRGYQKRVRFDFAPDFTIIDGRNGAGKSTIFDAVEFALTGTISKYLDAQADGETVENYLWWCGDSPTPQHRYVEIGFRDDQKIWSIRRTPMRDSEDALTKQIGMLVDRNCTPRSAIEQLCTATIIRDEHIARLSLDLKETDRFNRLRDAIGATDADGWVTRAHRLHTAAQGRVKSLLSVVNDANTRAQYAARQLDQARSSVPNSGEIEAAHERLRNALRTTTAGDELASLARNFLVTASKRQALLADISQRAEEALHQLNSINALEADLQFKTRARDEAKREVERCSELTSPNPSASTLAEVAQRFWRLADLGRALGRQEGQCPLCTSHIDGVQFEAGIKSAVDYAKRLDGQAVERAELERQYEFALHQLSQAEDELGSASGALNNARRAVEDFTKLCIDVDVDPSRPDLAKQQLEASNETQLRIAADLRLLDTLSLDRTLSRAMGEFATAREGVAAAEKRSGQARLAESRAKAIYDATRRAAHEALERRLEQVIPLMSELYKRLKPHPVWSDIEYRIRGDVRRFLKLQVGGGINPQFVFSSGQRRTTGLAFLLSINLAITWSRWRSILLDDPVQHVDDFRTVHLAEVLAHLCKRNRQIVCAVEDAALADLMCRRMVSAQTKSGKQIRLGIDTDGALAITSEAVVAPLISRALVPHVKSISA